MMIKPKQDTRFRRANWTKCDKGKVNLTLSYSPFLSNQIFSIVDYAIRYYTYGRDPTKNGGVHAWLGAFGTFSRDELSSLLDECDQ
jgi:hypothetical protein